MKILFVQESFSCSIPNVQLASSVQKELAKIGHSVFVLAQLEKEEVCPANAHIQYIPYTNKAIEKIHAHYKDINRLNGSAFQKIVKLMLYPPYFFSSLARWAVGFEVEAFFLSDAICKEDTIYQFDVIIAVTAPYKTAQAVARVKSKASKMIYMMDPFALSQSFRSPHATKIELNVGKKANSIAVTRLMYEDYKNSSALSPLLSKMFCIEFPGLCFNKRDRAPTPKNPHNEILFAYCGNLYAEIRSPESMLQLFSTLKLPNWQLTLMGGIYGNFPEGYMQSWKIQLRDHLNLLPSSSQEKANELLEEADILVNIGNTVSNQVPSKLFSYIATGKPILHVCLIHNCSSLLYLKEYPLAYIVLPNGQEGLSEERSFGKWAMEVKGKRVLQKTLERTYHENTPKYVAQQIENKLY